MKSIQTILAASALSLALGASSQAANVTIRFTGSSAYRSYVHTAIQSVLTGVQSGYEGTDVTKANSAIFQGTYNGDTVTVLTSWTGSEAGIQAVGANSSSITAKFQPVTASFTSGLAPASDAQIPDVAMSDTKNTTSQFSSYTLTEASNSPVGVCPFVWVGSAGIKAAGITSISPQQVKSLFNSGKSSVALFTGNSADELKPVFAVGRNPDSGTRLSAFAEAGIGALSTAKQYAPVDTIGNSGTTGLIGKSNPVAIAQLNLWPIETINGIGTGVLGNSGYNSGGDLGWALNCSDSSVKVGAKTYTGTTRCGLIGYVSTGDAANAVGTGKNGVQLKWNGVDYSTAAVIEGAYTFWSLEHMYYRWSSTDTTTAKKFADAVASNIKTTQAPIKIADLKVSRTNDGGQISPAFAY